MKLKNKPSLKDLQEFIGKVYSVTDDRLYDTWDILSNQERFMMRALKGIRKNDPKKLKYNLLIATSWFLAVMNRFHIDIEEATWSRFPYQCSYCAGVPCRCKIIKPKKRKKLNAHPIRRPKTLKDFQKMFEEIYPSSGRSLVDAGIHLAEEQGEVSEAVQVYFGSHQKRYFQNIIDESADYFSCLMGVFNSAGIDMEKEMMKFYSDGCHACHQAPCECSFVTVAEFAS
jgi:NTP pyrophosphatase (non-canonical NTP hydrolase)